MKKHRIFSFIFPLLVLIGFFSFGISTTSAQDFSNAYALFPGEQIGDFRTYVRNFYFFSIGAAMLIGVVMMMIGGMIWLTSAGNPGRVSKAKEYIIDSLFGIVLLISAYLVLQVVNPNLVNLESANLVKIPGTGSCVLPAINGETDGQCAQYNEIDCESWARELTDGQQPPTYTEGATCSEACIRYEEGTGRCVLQTRTFTIKYGDGNTFTEALKDELAALLATIPSAAGDAVKQATGDTLGTAFYEYTGDAEGAETVARETGYVLDAGAQTVVDVADIAAAPARGLGTLLGWGVSRFYD